MRKSLIVPTIIVAAYYVIFLLWIFIPSFVSPDVSYAVTILFSLALLYASPIVLLAIVYALVSVYKLYKKEVIKPVVPLVAFTVLSLLPIFFAIQLSGYFTVSMKMQNEIDVKYINEIPSIARSFMVTPNSETEKILNEKFELFFTEAEREGSSYVTIYKNKNEELSDYGQVIPGFTNLRKQLTYPNSYIEFKGTVAGDIFPRTCDPLDGIPNPLGGEESTYLCSQIFYELINDVEITILSSPKSNSYGAYLNGPQGFVAVNFALLPTDYDASRVIQIVTSLVQ